MAAVGVAAAGAVPGLAGAAGWLAESLMAGLAGLAVGLAGVGTARLARR
jgi:hypothetical protein